MCNINLLNTGNLAIRNPKIFKLTWLCNSCSFYSLASSLVEIFRARLSSSISSWKGLSLNSRVRIFFSDEVYATAAPSVKLLVSPLKNKTTFQKSWSTSLIYNFPTFKCIVVPSGGAVLGYREMVWKFLSLFTLNQSLPNTLRISVTSQCHKWRSIKVTKPDPLAPKDLHINFFLVPSVITLVSVPQ